jgi:hypothetical protein
MKGALLVDMSLPASDGAVIATISAKRDGKNRATEEASLAKLIRSLPCGKLGVVLGRFGGEEFGTR